MSDLRRTIVSLVLLCSAFLVGCGGAAMPDGALRDARDVVDDAADRAESAEPKLQAVRGAVDAACKPDAPLLGAERCAAAVPAFDGAAEDFEELRKLIDKLDLVLAVIESVAEASR